MSKLEPKLSLRLNSDRNRKCSRSWAPIAQAAAEATKYTAKAKTETEPERTYANLMPCSL